VYRHAALIAILVTSLLASGCGTVVNLVRPNDEPKAFGGIRFDIEQIDKLVSDGPADANGPLTSSGTGAALGALIFLAAPFADLPLSLLGDTLTYPLARWLDSR
jgi:uncharacterized protein YceK